MNPVRWDNNGNPVMWQDSNILYVRINGRLQECDENGAPINNRVNNNQPQYTVVERDYNNNPTIVKDDRGNLFSVDAYNNLTPYVQQDAFMNNGGNQIRNDYQQNNNQQPNNPISFGIQDSYTNNSIGGNVPRKYKDTRNVASENKQQQYESSNEVKHKPVVIDLSTYKPTEGSLFVPLTNDKTEYVDIIIRKDNNSYTYKIIKKD